MTTNRHLSGVVGRVYSADDGGGGGSTAGPTGSEGAASTGAADPTVSDKGTLDIGDYLPDGFGEEGAGGAGEGKGGVVTDPATDGGGEATDPDLDTKSLEELVDDGGVKEDGDLTFATLPDSYKSFKDIRFTVPENSPAALKEAAAKAQAAFENQVVGVANRDRALGAREQTLQVFGPFFEEIDSYKETAFTPVAFVSLVEKFAEGYEKDLGLAPGTLMGSIRSGGAGASADAGAAPKLEVPTFDDPEDQKIADAVGVYAQKVIDSQQSVVNGLMGRLDKLEKGTVKAVERMEGERAGQEKRQKFESMAGQVAPRVVESVKQQFHGLELTVAEVVEAMRKHPGPPMQAIKNEYFDKIMRHTATVASRGRARAPVVRGAKVDSAGKAGPDLSSGRVDIDHAIGGVSE
jgi:hypothetical protein